MIKGKKAVEWYILVALILLVFSIIVIILWQSGAFSRLSGIASNAFFKPLE